MDVFPEIMPDYGYVMGSTYRVQKVGPTDGNFVQRRKLASAALGQADCSWSNLSASELKELSDFFAAHSGSYGEFVFYDFIPREIDLFAVGTGNGSQRTWTLPHRDLTDYEVYFDGVKRSNAYYRVTNRTGSEGEDQIVFNDTPTNTINITMLATGARKYSPCIFAADAFSPVATGYNCYQLNLSITEISA